MKERELQAAADAVFDAERALRRAADALDELSDLATSSLRVLDEAATDAFNAHQEERRDFYMESATDHLARLRNRSGQMNELGEDLTHHLTAAGSAIERAGHELAHSNENWDESNDIEFQALRTQLDVLSEVVRLSRQLADQITRHAQQVAESATGTDAVMLLDERVHHADQQVTRADEDVSMMRSVIESAQSRARTSAALAGSLNYAASHPEATASHLHQTTHNKPSDPGIAI